MAKKREPDIMHRVPGWAPEHGGSFHDDRERLEWYTERAKRDAEEARKGKRK